MSEKEENKAPHLKIGEVGEGIAVKYLEKHGYKILDRNYRKKWGELDIITEKDGIIHFVEVKTKNVKTRVFTENEFSRENSFLPEERVNFNKRRRLLRAIQTYLMDHKIPDDTDWQFDIAVICLNFDTKKATVRFMDNVGL